MFYYYMFSENFFHTKRSIRKKIIELVNIWITDTNMNHKKQEKEVERGMLNMIICRLTFAIIKIGKKNQKKEREKYYQKTTYGKY